MTEHLEDRAIALQLHGVLTDIDPARWRDEMAAALKERLKEISLKLEQVSHRARMKPLASAMRAELSRLDEPSIEPRTRWLTFKQQLQPVYAGLAASLKIHVPALRPTNYSRNLFHAGSALAAVVTIELVRNPVTLLAIAVVWAAFAWTCEVSRRLSPAVNVQLMRVFGKVIHPHEIHRVNSATWYATALVLLALTQSTVLCAMAVVVLGVGDPLAALIGRRYGRVRLLHGRSLEGSLAFVLSAAAITFLMLRLGHLELGLGQAMLVAGAAALAGALAELFSLRIDDNFSIPLSAASGGALMLWALQLPV